MDSRDVTYIPESEPPRGGGSTKVLLIVAGVGVLSLVLCCGVGVAIFSWGTSELASQVADELRDNPVMQEHIGEIQEFEVDWIASSEAPGDDEFVFRVRGTKGEGTVRANCVTVDVEEEEVTDGTLTMDDGTEYDLFPEEP